MDSYNNNSLKAPQRFMEKKLKIVIVPLELQQQHKTKNINKSLLIKQLILKEQKRMKMFNTGVSELKINILSAKKEHLVTKELLEETKKIFGNDNFGESHKLLARTDLNLKDPLPTIQRHRLYKFLKNLTKKDELNSCQKEQKKCVADLNSTFQCHWNLPINILRAVKDCILNRRWNNLTHLILILIRLPGFQYRPLVRHVGIILFLFMPNILFLFKTSVQIFQQILNMCILYLQLCQILDKLHPAIHENGLTGQLSMVQRAAHLRK